jgi:FixJ family two-component response regulator
VREGWAEIADVNLPGMSGEELAVEARGLRGNLAVVFATGDHHVWSVPGAMMLRKPYDAVAIEAVLRQVK